MGWIGNRSDAHCPFINADDPRCGGRLTLRALDEAYTYCLGGFLSCPAYHRMSWEQQAREADDTPRNQDPRNQTTRNQDPRDHHRQNHGAPGDFNPAAPAYLGRPVRLTVAGRDPAAAPQERRPATPRLTLRRARA